MQGCAEAVPSNLRQPTFGLAWSLFPCGLLDHGRGEFEVFVASFDIESILLNCEYRKPVVTLISECANYVKNGQFFLVGKSKFL